MKKIILTAMMTVALTVNAQTLMIHEKGGIARYNAAMVDSITFDEQAQMPANIPYTTQMTINAHWCALGTSITYLNDYDKQGRFEKGYMDRTMDQLHFAKMTNQGVSGGCIRSAYDKVIKADYYTIAYWYRMVIDRIFAVNPKAKIVLCTPRKAYGFSGYLPSDCLGDINGVYLKDYVEIIRQIAQYEGFPLADFYAECGGQRDLARMSMDTALHPNDEGYQMMANVLIPALKKVITK